MRNKRFPNYPDDADYNTNSPSYYEDLARKQKLIELLSKKVWEYEEKLDLTLEDIETRVQQRFSEWDGRIESFPDNVENLFEEWLTDGTLDHIINDTIFNWKANKTYVDSEFERLDLKDNDHSTQLTEKASKISLGEVNQDLQITKQTINDMITTPADSISEQEIIDARKGNVSLGSKIEKMDQLSMEHSKTIYDFYYQNGYSYPSKTGEWEQGVKTITTNGGYTFNVDHIEISFENTGGVGALALTTNQIDMTSFDSLYVDWEIVSVGSNGGFAGFGIHKDVTPDYSVLNVRDRISEVGNRQTTKLDVSDIQGDYRINIQPYTNATNSAITIKVYNVYASNRLLNGHDNKAIEKTFETIYNQYNQQVYLNSEGHIYTDSLETLGGSYYFKIESGSIILREGNYSHEFFQSTIKESLGDYIGASPEGVEDCLIIPGAHSLVVDFSDGLPIKERLKIVHRSLYTPHKHILLLSQVDGVLVDGTLLNVIQNQELKELKNNGIVDPKEIETKEVLFNSLNKATTNPLVFGVITDTHGEGGLYERIRQHMRYLSNLNEYGKFNFIAHLGDVIDGKLSKKDALKNHIEFNRIVESHIPYYTLFGNHDDNSYNDSLTTDDLITRYDWRNFIMKNFIDDVVTNEEDEGSKYFYKDFDREKIRVVFLDGCDYPHSNSTEWTGFNAWGYTMNQLDWLANTALQLENKNDYHVLIVSHLGTQNAVGDYYYNGIVLEEILNAFKEGTSYEVTQTGQSIYNGELSVTFDSGGTLIGFIHGHNHLDRLYEVNGINFLSIVNSWQNVESSIDIFTINTDERMVYTTRFGHGEDRLFTY